MRLVTRAALACGAGALAVLAYAPFSWVLLMPLALMWLVRLLMPLHRARDGGLVVGAFAFGLLSVGLSWLFVALNVHGGLAAPLAVLAVMLLALLLASLYGLAGAALVVLRPRGILARSVLFAALWALAEWLRSVIMTGFPWLSVGYTQSVPSPLAGYFAVLGVFGVGALLVLCAGVLALTDWRAPRRVFASVCVVGAVLAGGQVLRGVPWTQPLGEPMDVALVQTNVAQDLKWAPDRLNEWLAVNYRLAVSAADADLVVLPETTLPLVMERLPRDYLDALATAMKARGSNLVFGVFSLREGRIYNAAVSLGADPSQFYAKRHLVPFGEYSPPMFGWFYDWVQIPMSDQTRGPPDQAPMRLGAQRVAVNICYEDVFGAGLLHALPEATLMLNLSNLAWYGNSHAQPQHLQIAQARALESGRPMLRATNTGMTALIGVNGQVLASLPPFRRDVLRVRVQGHQGMTPYARWADVPTVVLSLIIALIALLRRQKSR